VRAGRLRRVVSIQSPTQAQSATGAYETASWSTFAANVPADIDETPGREVIQAGQVNPQRPVQVTIRYTPGVTTEMRVLYGTRIFQIVGVQNLDQRNRVLVLECLEQAP
jgi:SPP1 family predicted phage head-tail adaptor